MDRPTSRFRSAPHMPLAQSVWTRNCITHIVPKVLGVPAHLLPWCPITSLLIIPVAPPLRHVQIQKVGVTLLSSGGEVSPNLISQILFDQVLGGLDGL